MHYVCTRTRSPRPQLAAAAGRIHVDRRMAVSWSAFIAVVLLLNLCSLIILAQDEQCTISDTGEKVCGAPSSSCVNNHENCDFWAGEGECKNNPKYMLKNCARACNVCSPAGRPRRQPATSDKEMLLEMVKEYGEGQVVEGQEESATLLVLRKTVTYMKNFVLVDKPTHTMSKDVIEKCRNRHDKCAFWSAIGECEVNPAWMATNCAPSCRSCHLIDFATRCPPRDPSVKPALTPNSLNKMFEKIVETAPGNRSTADSDAPAGVELPDRTPPYTVKIHSRPWTDEKDNLTGSDKKYGGPPWVVTFDNFITDEECDHLIQLGYDAEYKRSEDVGGKKFDGSHDSIQSTRRTSENAWCSDKSGCRDDGTVQRVMNRIGNVTGIPSDHSEDFQILKYQEGQFYRAHHDYIPHQKQRQCGPRILTFFLYLSDVEEGGGTAFPSLPLTVMPKKGRALLWPSVLNEDPTNMDPRTRHEALPVEKGTKFAANAWIHLYDYITPQGKGCN